MGRYNGLCVYVKRSYKGQKVWRKPSHIRKVEVLWATNCFGLWDSYSCQLDSRT